MNKEEFYDQLNSLIEELTIDYAQRLRGVSEDILKKVEGDMIDADEIASYIHEQEQLFKDRLNSTIDDIESKVENILSTQTEMKENILIKIRNSFDRIYKSIVNRLSDLF